MDPIRRAIKSHAAASFRDPMAQSMGELQSIMAAGRSPTADGRLSARMIEVAQPAPYDAAAVRRARTALNVSQAVFASLLGASDVLVRSWERGVPQPALVARQLLDQIRDHPAQFARLIRHADVPGHGTPPTPPPPGRRKPRPAA